MHCQGQSTLCEKLDHSCKGIQPQKNRGVTFGMVSKESQKNIIHFKGSQILRNTHVAGMLAGIRGSRDSRHHRRAVAAGGLQGFP